MNDVLNVREWISQSNSQFEFVNPYKVKRFKDNKHFALGGPIYNRIIKVEILMCHLQLFIASFVSDKINVRLQCHASNRHKKEQAVSQFLTIPINEVENIKEGILYNVLEDFRKTYTL